MPESRRQWLQMMASIGATALIPREALRLLQQAQDPVAAARAQLGAVPIQSRRLDDKLTLLSGPGGNVVVLNGGAVLVVVDTFLAPAWPRLEETLKGFGAPAKLVINTHWHFDHTDNNPAFRALGATVVAHENTRKRMTEPHHLPMLELDFPPSPPGALPQRVFSDSDAIKVGSEEISLWHVDPAHTDSDVIVRFEGHNVLQAGDVFFNGRYPFIDWSTGGKIAGMIAGADRLLKMADASTMIVPGHGALATRADLVKYRDMLSTAADRVRTLKTSGKTLEEAVAAKPLADLDADWAGGRFKGADFVKIVYNTL